MYTVIQWPEIQAYMDIPGFRDNSYLVNDELVKGIEDFGSSAYFVDVQWLEGINYEES